MQDLTSKRTYVPGRVSTVIATYNMAKFLSQAVESALNQTYRDVEVCIVDDGSTDNTAELFERWCGDPRIKLGTQKNAGQAVAKNHGARLGSGEYVAFLDADDFWTPDKLDKQLPLFALPRVGVVYAGCQRVDETGQRLPRGDWNPHSGKVTGELLLENFVPYVTAVVRHEAFDKVGGFDESLGMGIDWDLWLRMSVEHEFAYVEDVLTMYRVWPGQMSNKYRQRLDAALHIMGRFLDRYPHSVRPDQMKQAWAESYVKRGDVLLTAERRRVPAIKEMMKALRYKPAYWPAWRSIARAIVTTRPFKTAT
ncbi:MAG TPA: glycosyltransferase [Povalibacter sp.]|uniref:glycosyltransferase n=1 Tax=Povalibacter sp. TaxID=1962978 RepID=UPI002D1BD23A|nr:glycosyltransferase [Povalibacter sp.]HMN42967.1 glycosyltransferase [Povalibacter sp.]